MALCYQARATEEATTDVRESTFLGGVGGYDGGLGYGGGLYGGGYPSFGGGGYGGFNGAANANNVAAAALAQQAALATRNNAAAEAARKNKVKSVYFKKGIVFHTKNADSSAYKAASAKNEATNKGKAVAQNAALVAARQRRFGGGGW